MSEWLVQQVPVVCSGDPLDDLWNRRRTRTAVGHDRHAGGPEGHGCLGRGCGVQHSWFPSLGQQLGCVPDSGECLSGSPIELSCRVAVRG